MSLGNRSDFQAGQLAVIAFAAAVFEGGYLGGAMLVNDLGMNESAFDEGIADEGSLSVVHVEDFRKRRFSTDLKGQFFHVELVARFNFVLLAAGFENRVGHGNVRCLRRGVGTRRPVDAERSASSGQTGRQNPHALHFGKGKVSIWLKSEGNAVLVEHE